MKQSGSEPYNMGFKWTYLNGVFQFYWVVLALTCFNMIIGVKSYGQNSEPGRGVVFYKGAYASLDYNYRDLWVIDKSADVQDIVEIRDDTEVPLFGYTAGLAVGIRKEKNEFGLKFGFALRGYQTRRKNASGLIPSELKSFQVEYRTSFIDLSFTHSHLWPVKNGSIALSSALGLGYLIEERNWTRIQYNNGDRRISRSTSPYDYYRFNVLGGFGVSYNRPLSKSVHLRFGPHFQIILNKMIDKPITFRLYHFGLCTTVLFSGQE